MNGHGNVFSVFLFFSFLFSNDDDFLRVDIALINDFCLLVYRLDVGGFLLSCSTGHQASSSQGLQVIRTGNSDVLLGCSDAI